MSDTQDEGVVTFVLTGPRKGFSGVLANRYLFKNGEFTAQAPFKDQFKSVLCTRYCCNIKGEAKLWDTVDGASVKIKHVDLPKAETTTIVDDAPQAMVKAPAPSKK